VPPRRRPSRADCELGQVCGQPGARGVCAGVAATLFGNAEVLEDGNVRLVADADTAPPSAGVRFDIGAGVDIGEITRLEAVYDSEVAPGCRGGSPRFQLGISAGNVFVYFSPDNTRATGPNETPNFIENDSDVYFDASQIQAGRQRITCSEARGILKERELAVERISLVVDGARPGNPQRVVVRPRVDVRRVPGQTA
jgi:hypothetical protein